MRAGRVGRPHGLDGSFHVIEPRPQLLVEGVELDGLGRIVGRKGTDAKPIVRVEAASDRTAAERLRGRELIVVDPPEIELGEDEYLAEDLEGCVVATDAGRTLGTVRRLLNYPSCDLLELDDGSLVPMVRDCIRQIDVAAKRIEVDGGFLGAA
jgi:16S rRNA processing protein RimM